MAESRTASSLASCIKESEIQQQGADSASNAANVISRVRRPSMRSTYSDIARHEGPLSTVDLERKLSGVAAEDFKPTRPLYIAFTTLAVITLMVALDGTSLSVALPIIAERLNGSGIEAFWAGTSFLLTSAVFQPCFASMSDIFGRRPLVYAALLFFLLGAIIAGVAKNFTSLLVGRSLQGVGGGGLVVLTSILVTDLIPLRLRGKWFGIISGMWSIGSVCGPVIGGGLAGAGNGGEWRWIFYINFPFIAVAGVFVYLFIRLKFPLSSMASKLKRIDYPGTILFISSTTAILIPLTWGGVSYPWSSWRTLTPLLLGIFGEAIFILWSVKFTHQFGFDPLIPKEVFTNSYTTSLAYFDTTLHGMILWSLLYYLPLYYEAVKNQSPVIAGVSLFPDTFTVAPAAVAVGLLITKSGHYRWAIWTGWIITTLGLGINVLLDVNTTTVQYIFITVVNGIGIGMLFPSLSFAVQASCTPRTLAFAIALFTFFRAFGQTLGVAIGGTIFQNQMKQNLLKSPLLATRAVDYSRDAAALVQIVRRMTAAIANNKASGQLDATLVLERQILVQAYADTLKVVNGTMCGIAALGGLVSCFIKSYDINAPLSTLQAFEHHDLKQQPTDVEKNEPKVE